MPRFEVYVSSKATSRDDWRKPVVVRVIDTSQSFWHAVRKLNDGVVYESGIVDSRYDGPRAGYGKAIRTAGRIRQGDPNGEPDRIRDERGRGRGPAGNPGVPARPFRWRASVR